MSLNRRAARRDANEPEIVEALQTAGATVQTLSAKGVPDLLVGFRGETYLFEVKIPLGPLGGAPQHQHLNKKQDEWHRKWRGGTCVVVRSVDDALRAIGAL